MLRPHPIATANNAQREVRTFRLVLGFSEDPEAERDIHVFRTTLSRVVLSRSPEEPSTYGGVSSNYGVVVTKL
jgi:hypothetical protein